jgi:hypothetical protein
MLTLEGSCHTPNAKNKLRSCYPKKTREEIKAFVIHEFTALRFAKIISPAIVRDAKLGKVTEGDDKERFFLMKELAGQKEREDFQTFGKDSKVAISKDMWKFTFATSVGLLNN